MAGFGRGDRAFGLTTLPADAHTLFNRGLVLTGLGRRDEATEAYRQAVALEPTSSRYRLQLAQSLWDTEQYHQAINEWRIVCAAEPYNLGAQLALARAYLKVSERLEALRPEALWQYQKILDIDAANTEARRALGRD